jgi:hypothetical protein
MPRDVRQRASVSPNGRAYTHASQRELYWSLSICEVRVRRVALSRQSSSGV